MLGQSTAMQVREFYVTLKYEPQQPRKQYVLQVTFADTLGAAKHQEDSEVTSKNEAKKLAFYLFWNIKPSFNRLVPCRCLTTPSWM